MIKGLHHNAYRCRDSEETRRFYEDFLGLPLVNAFVCGEAITIADYLGAMMVLGGEVISCKLAAYPNISRWLGGMKALPSWNSVNEAFYKFIVEPNKAKSFVCL